MKTIVLATNNLHKINEINSFFEGKIKFIIPADIGVYEFSEENGVDFKENATIKLKDFSTKIDYPILADDSGLIVKTLSSFIQKIKSSNFDIKKIANNLSSFFDFPYKQDIANFWIQYMNKLDLFPGVVSKRFGFIENEKDRNHYLIELLKQIDIFENNKQKKENPEWEAYFETVLALRLNGKILHFNGIAEGYIIDMPAGTNGFGYDPIFYYPPLNKTFAQLTLNEKNSVSHRSRALLKLKEFLNNYDF